MKKHFNEAALENELQGSAFFSQGTPRPSQRKQQDPTQNKGLDRNTEENTEVRESLRKDVRKPRRTTISERKIIAASNPLDGEVIEQLSFQLRKEQKARLTTDVPLAWRKELDDLAHGLEVGKYELLMYIIGLFLEKVEEGEVDV